MAKANAVNLTGKSKVKLNPATVHVYVRCPKCDTKYDKHDHKSCPECKGKGKDVTPSAT